MLNIVTPSKWLADLVKQSYLQDYPVSIINNGIDLNVFKPSSSTFRNQYSLHGQFIILGVAAIWNERKGYQFFIDLAKRLRPTEKVVLVGASESQIMHLPAGITGIVRTANTTELAEIYSAADVFINPTLEDNFPTTNLEALACGTPIITFNTGGSPECVVDGCGLVVERSDLQGLVEAIQTVRNNGKEFYSSNCRSLAVQRYNRDVRFAEYLELYKSCVEK